MNATYVGSTKDLKKRLQRHKSNCCCETSRFHHFKVYQSIRKVGWDKIGIMIIDKVIYNSEDEALDMETKYMLMFDAKLNSRYPKRTKEEYYEANKEKISERDRRYRESNSEMVREKKKKYYDENRSKVLKQKQEYYESNKANILEKTKEARKQHYDKTKVKILEKMKEKIPCEICNKCLRKDGMKRHMKSQH